MTPNGSAVERISTDTIWVAPLDADGNVAGPMVKITGVTNVSFTRGVGGFDE